MFLLHVCWLSASPNLWVVFVSSPRACLMASCILPIISASSAWTINMVSHRFIAVFLIVLSSTKLKRIVGIASPCCTPCCRGNSSDVSLFTWNNNLIRFVRPCNLYGVKVWNTTVYCKNLKNYNVVQGRGGDVKVVR